MAPVIPRVILLCCWGPKLLQPIKVLQPGRRDRYGAPNHGHPCGWRAVVRPIGEVTASPASRWSGRPSITQRGNSHHPSGMLCGRFAALHVPTSVAFIANEHALILRSGSSLKSHLIRARGHPAHPSPYTWERRVATHTSPWCVAAVFWWLRGVVSSAQSADRAPCCYAGHPRPPGSHSRVTRARRPVGITARC